jgi:RHS repeat-associated protein
MRGESIFWIWRTYPDRKATARLRSRLRRSQDAPSAGGQPRHGRRVLSQEGASEQSDLQTGSQAWGYNANGQPETVGQREYVWDALGRLVEVREEAQPLAELDGQGRIQRQYIYMANMALAVIDQPRPLLSQTPGAAHVSATQAGFALRLPGQVWDNETGLHYNRQRYYDPEQGQYLTPDPLGTPDGPNPYAYVALNPLGFIDPDGLILFAFDGTGNDLSDAGSLTNVARFVDIYQDGGRRYVTGVGTQHVDNNWGNINVPLGDAGHRATWVSPTSHPTTAA